jgi:threonine dehydrogenase-like Zn-dependent dehydrogenase
LTIAVITASDVSADVATLTAAAKGVPIDAYIDFCPPEAKATTHMKSALMVLKPFGRACLMGGIQADVEVPYGLVMVKSLELRGRFMYERAAVSRLVRMVETGLLDLSGVRMEGVPLEKWDEAFVKSALPEMKGSGRGVVIVP